MNRLLFIFASLMVFAFSNPGYCEDKSLAGLFKEKNIKGTIVITSLDGEKSYIHDEKRAISRFVPASTFKIPNTLIALEESAVKDEKEILKWDQKDKGLLAWNRDQSIESAFKSSCIWFYQEMARRVGKEKYEFHLKKLNYGNCKTGPGLDTFWLEGDLKISAVEQISFLKNIYERKFRFKTSSYELLTRMMILEKTPSYTLRAKTGWAQRVTPQIGWFVGYVETGNGVWFFATNIDIEKPGDSDLRQKITINALKLLKII